MFRVLVIKKSNFIFKINIYFSLFFNKIFVKFIISLGLGKDFPNPLFNIGILNRLTQEMLQTDTDISKITFFHSTVSFKHTLSLNLKCAM